MTGNSKSVIAPQKVIPANLITTEEQLEGQSISSDQGGYNPHQGTGTHRSPYNSTSAVLVGIPDCLP